MLECPDEELLDLLAAAYRVRRRWFGNEVQLYFLMNAKSGLCPEDCSYCSQSKVSEAEIPRYNLLSRDKLLDGARMAAERKARTYCIVISARGPNEREMQAVTTIVPEIKQQYNLKICACLGLLTPEQAQAVEGVRRRPREPQPQHQRKLLRRDLHDAHLRRPRRHAARRARRRHGDVLRRHHRHGRAAAGRRRHGDRAARPGRPIDPGQLSQPDRRHAARRPAATSTRATA